jgi:exoribonuclease R
MRATSAAAAAITDGLGRLRAELDIAGDFPPAVVADAEQSVRRAPGAEHVDRTDLPFVTLDPASSTDLDQAFHLERAGDDLLLRYAIADVGWFVQPGSPLDLEAWHRGTTMYLPDGRSSLYPTQLSEGAASLLPDGPRPAIVFMVRLDGAGVARLDGVERAVIRSRAKLAYDSVRPDQLPADLPEFARRMDAADLARGAARVEPPEQVVVRDPDDGFRVEFAPRLESESANASMSLATNLAVGAALQAAHTGLFRVMDEPDARAIGRLRHTARAMGVPWPGNVTLPEFERGLDPADPRHAAIMLAIRRAGGGARYVPYQDGVVPWHAAMAATYAHATAPLRRLADRYVCLAALAVANGRPVPDEVTRAFGELPEVMATADTTANRLDRGVLDLVEAVVLHGREGQTFAAVVTDVDERGARIQLSDVAVVARVNARGVDPGDELRVKLVEASPAQRLVRFDRVA